ncbi:MAG: transglutaminase-like domain-containing protein [Spirochaetes bacterium]|nr:transglutaminase-like domain-containing protein [Spirochaetota bacterium]
MRLASEQGNRTTLLALRSLALAWLAVHAALLLRPLASVGFQAGTVAAAVLAAFAMERARLRLLPALLAAAALPFVARGVAFLVFQLVQRAADGPGADLLPLLFDRDFVPGLAVWAVAWLFTFLAQRRPGFVFVETGLTALILVGLLWGQAHYRLTLYPHPSLFALSLGVFIFDEIAVLLLARAAESRAENTPVVPIPALSAGSVPRQRRAASRPLLSFALAALPLLLVFLFFLLARYRESGTAAGGGLTKPTLFRFDFSQLVRLESEISTTDDTVLLLRVDGEAETWLLRRFVLSGYDPRQGFFIDRGRDFAEHPQTIPDAPADLGDPGWRDRETVEQEYFFLSIDPGSLVAVNQPVRVMPLKNWKGSPFLRIYRATSAAVRSDEAAARIQDAPAMEPGAFAWYTRYGGDERIRELAIEVTGGLAGYAERVRAIEEWLRGNYLYSLHPGVAADGNQLHHFLFESRKGYCSYFAFAMALMCRSVGIPARVAVGFLVPRETEVLNFYEVRAFQAHAWVEVWFGDLGWIEFDPTSQELAPGEDFTPFLGPDLDELARLIRQVLEHQDALEEEQAGPPTPSETLSRLAAGAVRILSAAVRWWFVVLPAGYLLLLAGLKLGPSLPSILLPRPQRSRAKALYRLALVLLAGVGAVRRGGESHLEFARRILADRGIALPDLAARYLDAEFAHDFDAGDLATFLEARSTFHRSFRQRVRLPSRVLGLLNPFGVPAVPR